jgi:hypothetical protein
LLPCICTLLSSSLLSSVPHPSHSLNHVCVPTLQVSAPESL